MGKAQDSTTTTQIRNPWTPASGALQLGLSQLSPAYMQSLGLDVPSSLQQAAQRPPLPTAPNAADYTAPATTRQTGGWDYQYNRSPQQIYEPGSFNQAAFNAANAQYQQQLAAYQNWKPPDQQTNVYDQLASQGANQMLGTIRGDYLMNSPYIDEVLRRTASDVNSQFEGSGRYGSGAHQDALARAEGAIRYANYQAERQNQLGAIQQAQQASLYPYTLYNTQVGAVYDPIAAYTDIATRYGNIGVEGQTIEPLYRNRTAGALGGAATGAGIASTLGSSNPWVLGAAAVAGGLLGAYG